LSVIFSENRGTLFRIMRQSSGARAQTVKLRCDATRGILRNWRQSAGRLSIAFSSEVGTASREEMRRNKTLEPGFDLTGTEKAPGQSG
jgi:hypothetical protein